MQDEDYTHDQEMAEGEPEYSKIQSVFINFENKSMMVEGETNWMLFNLTPQGITYAIVDSPPEMVQGMRINLVPPARQEVVAAELQKAEAEASKTVTLTGKIKGLPRAGRPDSKGHPTAWARLAVHEEGQELAKMMSTTFHRATVPIALNLKPEDQITVQGYIRPASDPSRMDSMSVFHVPNYPGKPPAPQG